MLNQLDLTQLIVYRPSIVDNCLVLKRITTYEMCAITCTFRCLGYVCNFELLSLHSYKLTILESK